MKVNTPENAEKVALAIIGVMGPGLQGAAALARAEALKYTHAVDVINGLFKSGEIGLDELKAQLDIQRTANVGVLAGIAGMTSVIATQAIDAGIKAIAAIINTAIGVAIFAV